MPKLLARSSHVLLIGTDAYSVTARLPPQGPVFFSSPFACPRRFPVFQAHYQGGSCPGDGAAVSADTAVLGPTRAPPGCEKQEGKMRAKFNFVLFGHIQNTWKTLPKSSQWDDKHRALKAPTVLLSLLILAACHRRLPLPRRDRICCRHQWVHRLGIFHLISPPTVEFH